MTKWVRNEPSYKQDISRDKDIKPINLLNSLPSDRWNTEPTMLKKNASVKITSCPILPQRKIQRSNLPHSSNTTH